MIRSQLQRTRPRDAVVGEEFEPTGHGPRRWVVDPIDGTKNYVRGVPVWATLIALVVDEEPVLGLVSAPALGRRWWAAGGSGAWTGRSLSAARRLHVSKVASVVGRLAVLLRASASGGPTAGVTASPSWPGSCWRTRAYGDFWSYMLVAEGSVDIACEPDLKLHDMAALVPVVTEAGGRFTSLDGRDGPWGGSALATNGALHDERTASFAAGPGCGRTSAPRGLTARSFFHRVAAWHGIRPDPRAVP